MSALTRLSSSCLLILWCHLFAAAHSSPAVLAQITSGELPQASTSTDAIPTSPSNIFPITSDTAYPTTTSDRFPSTEPPTGNGISVLNPGTQATRSSFMIAVPSGPMEQISSATLIPTSTSSSRKEPIYSAVLDPTSSSLDVLQPTDFTVAGTSNPPVMQASAQPDLAGPSTKASQQPQITAIPTTIYYTNSNGQTTATSIAWVMPGYLTVPAGSTITYDGNPIIIETTSGTAAIIGSTRTIPVVLPNTTASVMMSVFGSLRTSSTSPSTQPVQAASQTSSTGSGASSTFRDAQRSRSAAWTSIMSVVLSLAIGLALGGATVMPWS